LLADVVVLFEEGEICVAYFFALAANDDLGLSYFLLVVVVLLLGVLVFSSFFIVFWVLV